MRTEALDAYYQKVSAQVESIRAGVDWLSCTLARDARSAQEWVRTCQECIIEISAEGHVLGDFGINGYRGVIAGGSFIGQREDSFFCQLSGRYAEVYFNRVMRDDLHISRIDLAVTVQFRVMPQSLGATAYAVASEADRGLSTARRRKIWYMSGSDGGYTLYIGSPSSDQRGRLYNKEVQSGTPEYERTWRYEIVLRNARAMACVETLLACPVADRLGCCSSLVGGWYQSRGVSVPWKTLAHYAVLPVVAQAPSDAEKKLEWLSKQVKPAVAWLIEAGYGEAVIVALGIHL